MIEVTESIQLVKREEWKKDHDDDTQCLRNGATSSSCQGDVSRLEILLSLSLSFI